MLKVTLYVPGAVVQHLSKPFVNVPSRVLTVVSSAKPQVPLPPRPSKDTPVAQLALFGCRESYHSAELAGCLCCSELAAWVSEVPTVVVAHHVNLCHFACFALCAFQEEELQRLLLSIVRVIVLQT